MWLPDVIKRWNERAGEEKNRTRFEQSFLVPKEEIVSEEYDLSLGKYKKIIETKIDHTPPIQIIAELKAIDEKIRAELADFEGILK